MFPVKVLMNGQNDLLSKSDPYTHKIKNREHIKMGMGK